MIVILSSIVPPIYHKSKFGYLTVTFYSPDIIHRFLLQKMGEERYFGPFTSINPETLPAFLVTYSRRNHSYFCFKAICSNSYPFHYKVVMLSACTCYMR
jgi:hypothetical protein